MQAVHFKRKLGRSGDWDVDTATSHVYRRADLGITLCGIAVGKLLDHGGPWEINNWPEYQASCARCQHRRKAIDHQPQARD